LKKGEMENKTEGRPLWGYGHHKPWNTEWDGV